MGAYVLGRRASLEGNLTLIKRSSMPLVGRGMLRAQKLGGEDGDDGGLDGNAGDECIGLGEIDVHLAPDAEFAWEIDAGLDRKARVREQTASIPGLEVVDVGAVAVDFFADRVPGTVDEPVFVPRLPDHAAAHVVHAPAW